MKLATCRPAAGRESVPSELAALRDRVMSQPSEVRDVLVPLLDEAMEDALFRHRVLDVAQSALAQYRHDLEITRFDLDATRRERAALLERLNALGDDD